MFAWIKFFTTNKVKENSKKIDEHETMNDQIH